MSHCPGSSLEDWITDWYRLVDEKGEYGTGIRRLYKDQLVLNDEQFKKLVEIHESIREHIENLLVDFDEETMSWRDYCGCFHIPIHIEKAAEEYINSIRNTVNITKGIS